MAPPSAIPTDTPPEFYSLVALSTGRPRNGWFKLACPNCGDQKGHFEFCERFGHCVKCDYTIGIRKLAALVNAGPPPAIPKPIPKPRRDPLPWQSDPDVLKPYLSRLPSALRYYKSRGFSAETIEQYQLGYGPLPKGSARCSCERYILPVFEVIDGARKLVAIKGRRREGIGCDHAKWLPAAGSKSVLFNAEHLRSGATVLVTAAPYNTMLAMQANPGLVAVAPSNGEGQWKPEWSEQIKASRPMGVILAYDNDDTGRQATAKVTKALRSVGLNPFPFAWPVGTPDKYDVADFILDHGPLPIYAAPDNRVNPKYRPKDEIMAEFV